MPETPDDIDLQSEKDPRNTNISKKSVKEGSEADRSLFLLISQSDEQAFERIFDKHTSILYPYFLDLVKTEADAKEIIQEVFLKLWLKRYFLSAIENPGGWLYTVAADEVYGHFKIEARYAKRHRKIEAESINGSSDPNLGDIHEQFDSREVKILIADAVKQLPIRRRQVFQMSRLEGYSGKEIAETLGITEKTVRNQLADAIEFIQDYIIKNKSLYLPALLIGLIGSVGT